MEIFMIVINILAIISTCFRDSDRIGSFDLLAWQVISLIWVINLLISR